MFKSSLKINLNLNPLTKNFRHYSHKWNFSYNVEKILFYGVYKLNKIDKHDCYIHDERITDTCNCCK